MTFQTGLARQALRGALETRRRSNEAKIDPICVYDVAERLGVEVKFCLGSSLGGGYARASGTIIVPSLRPAGRQVFTCAHELGHWFFDHGARLDELYELYDVTYTNPDEQLVDLYAAYLLMPSWAIEHALRLREWNACDLTPGRAYAIACQFGVGYETVIQHLRFSLKMIVPQHALVLLKTTPKKLRGQILGDTRLRHLVIVDAHWRCVPIDIQVGDVAVVTRAISLDGTCARITGECPTGCVIEGIKPGIVMARATDGPWAVAIRVRRRDFEGRSIYRHMEDSDVDEDA